MFFRQKSFGKPLDLSLALRIDEDLGYLRQHTGWDVRSVLEELSHGFRLGEWLVKPLANKLIGDDGEVHLEPKVMDTLVQLALAGGEVVSRRELLDSVWQRVVINEETLTRTISELRAALGDKGRQRRYITTVPKRGYSLAEDVVVLGVADIKNVTGQSKTPAIAVMPFANRSGREDGNYFAEGLTEELICALAKINGLHVAASTSVFSINERRATIQEIGASLGVAYLLEGAVQREADRLRVTTQLIRIEDGFQIWAENFDRHVQDVFQIQEDIARAVTGALKLKLGLGDQAPLVSSRVNNLEAYDCFLKARLRYQNEQQGMIYSGLEEAIEATQLAPDFAEAEGLAAIILSLNSVSEPYFKNASRISHHIEAALSDNPFQEEALMARAINIRWTTWDWARVRAQFERALAAAPNCPHVLVQFGTRFYRDLCQFDAAEVLIERAVRFDPINAAPRTSLGFNLRYQARFEEAIEQFDLALRINPTHGYAQLGKLLSLLSLERFDDAQEVIRTVATALGPDDLLTANCQARYYACVGDEARARLYITMVEKLIKTSGGEKHLPLPGWVELLLGNTDAGIYWLDRALDQQISQVLVTRAFIATLPHQGMLKADSVQKFLAKMSMDDASVNGLAKAGVLEPYY